VFPLPPQSFQTAAHFGQQCVGIERLFEQAGTTERRCPFLAGEAQGFFPSSTAPGSAPGARCPVWLSGYRWSGAGGSICLLSRSPTRALRKHDPSLALARFRLQAPECLTQVDKERDPRSLSGTGAKRTKRKGTNSLLARLWGRHTRALREYDSASGAGEISLAGAGEPGTLKRDTLGQGGVLNRPGAP
jgi:hypothetical protein